MYKLENLEPSFLESPRIPYVSTRAKGIYANILLDYWFKRTFAELPFSERLLILLLQELIPERKIASLSYVHQEHTNPYPDARGVRVDVEVTDENGSRFLVEMQREPQDWFYERAIYYASHCILQQMPLGQDDFSFLALHNMQFLEERPDALRQEIFDLLFEAAEIATFTPEDKVKYEFEMTTERDIRNQIAFARKEKAKEMARNMLAKGYALEEIAEITELPVEQIRVLQEEA